MGVRVATTPAPLPSASLLSTLSHTQSHTPCNTRSLPACLQVLMNFVMVCSMCVTSPLILPFGLLYFVGLWAVWRYQMLYVYQRQYESGGQVGGWAGGWARRCCTACRWEDGCVLEFLCACVRGDI